MRLCFLNVSSSDLASFNLGDKSSFIQLHETNDAHDAHDAHDASDVSNRRPIVARFHCLPHDSLVHARVLF
jgi:hypothetical protein